MKQLERRIIKLEGRRAASAEGQMLRDMGTFIDFLTNSEIEEYKRLSKEFGAVFTLDPSEAHPAHRNIVLRSATRRERYPRLWRAQHLHNWGDPVVPEPWSAEAEIEAFRNKIAINWERRAGVALDLDPLTPDDLTVMNYLLPMSYGLPNWESVKFVATPNDVEQVLAKVCLVSRAAQPIERDQSKLPVREDMKWEDVGRPLTWSDVLLDPATFPWEEWRQAGRESWWRTRAQQS